MSRFSNLFKETSTEEVKVETKKEVENTSLKVESVEESSAPKTTVTKKRKTV